MKKLRPIKSSRVFQKFGENKLSFYKEYGMLGHNGYDIPCPTGEEIRFEVKDCRGRVYKKVLDNSGGLGLDIITDDEDGIFKHRYWHLKDFSVEVGQTVETGDLLGHADNTGRSTGSHLHWSLKPQGVSAKGNYYNLEQNNGYFGAVDFDYEDIYVQDYMNNLKAQISILTKIIDLVKRFLKGRKRS